MADVRVRPIAVGDYHVRYGADSIVSVAEVSGSGYVITGRSRVRLVAGTHDLPPGTRLARVRPVGGNLYTGRHGLWNAKTGEPAGDCSISLAVGVNDFTVSFSDAGGFVAVYTKVSDPLDVVEAALAVGGGVSRAGEARSGVVDTFTVKGAVSNGDDLGPSECTVTSTRLIVRGSRRGRTHQVLLRDIVQIQPYAGLFSMKRICINTPNSGLLLFCSSSDEVHAIAATLEGALRR